MAEEDYPSNEIGNLPGVSTFGHTFNYAVWTPGTEVTLANVPWNSDYRDIAYFSSKSELSAYLDNTSRAGFTIKIDKMTYARPGSPIRINLPFQNVYQYNYIRVSNAAQPVTGSGKNFDYAETNPHVLFYFITDVRYLAPNTTEIMVQLDVWQSFSDSITFGNCYIERGHIGIANENNFANNGRDYLTIPEGLDVGGEYVINDVHEHTLLNIYDPDFNNRGCVLVASTVPLDGDHGTVDDPILRSATGSRWGELPNGCNLYLFESPLHWSDYTTVMSDRPWVTQGIIMATLVPIKGYNDDSANWRVGTKDVSITRGSLTIDFLELESGHLSHLMTGGNADIYNLRSNWRDDINLGRYSLLKKFLTYPYTLVELTMYTGNPLVLKPESMWGDDLEVMIKNYASIPAPRLVVMPYKYNAVNGAYTTIAGGVANDYGEMYDMQTGIFNYPTFSVVNNGYMGFLASNSNSIAYQHQSADWAQERALKGAGVSHLNTERGLDNTRNIASRGITAAGQTHSLAQQTLDYRTMQSIGNSALGSVGGVAGRNPAAVLGGVQGSVNAAVSNAIDSNQLRQQYGINVSSTRDIADMNRATGGAINDTNLNYAQFAARGDYQNTIAGINAKVQDAKMIQPTTSGQIGGDAFQVAMNKWAVYAKVKILQPAVMAMIGEYWLRYGYAVNRFGRMPSDFQVMSKFTYWKLTETYIYSSHCPETFRMAIRGIFEKGVTVWGNADDMGDIDMSTNQPKPGVTL